MKRTLVLGALLLGLLALAACGLTCNEPNPCNQPNPCNPPNPPNACNPCG